MRVYLLIVAVAILSISLMISAKPFVASEAETLLSEHKKVLKSEAIDLLRRLTREAGKNDNGNRTRKGKSGCKYRKGQWSACDPQTRVRVRTFTLKKGDVTVCEATKTLRKDCKGPRKGGKQRKNKSKNRNNAAEIQTQMDRNL